MYCFVICKVEFPSEKQSSLKLLFLFETFQDSDGFVGQEDYRLAKHLDHSRKGYLMADAFFKKHANHLEKFGATYQGNSHDENVDNMVNGK
jgi:hypothetical protein